MYTCVRMSVSRTGDMDGEFTIEQLQSYNEGVEVATFTHRAQADTDFWSQNESFDTLTSTGEDVQVEDILDLARNQVAELIAIERTVFQMEHRTRDGVIEEPGTAKVDAQFYLNDFPLTMESEGPRKSDEDGDGDNEYRAIYLGASEGNVTRDDGALLWKDEGVVGQAFNDDTSGSGGSGYTQSLGHFMRNYRDLADHGPLLYPDDIISGAMYIDLNNWENDDIKVYQQVKMYFDVYETQTDQYNDVPLTRSR